MSYNVLKFNWFNSGCLKTWNSDHQPLKTVKSQLRMINHVTVHKLEAYFSNSFIELLLGGAHFRVRRLRLGWRHFLRHCQKLTLTSVTEHLRDFHCSRYYTGLTTPQCIEEEVSVNPSWVVGKCQWEFTYIQNHYDYVVKTNKTVVTSNPLILMLGCVFLVVLLLLFFSLIYLEMV